jgi:hypothetical protein
VIAVAIVIGVIGFLTSGVIAGLGLLLGFPGVLSLILLYLPSRPKVVATLRGGENAITGNGEVGLIVGGEKTIRPLDIERIVQEEEHKALETMPRAPAPRVPPGAFGGTFDLNRSTAKMLSSLGGASDEELRAFIEKVHGYGGELRGWLGQLEASRQERLRAFTAIARVREAGQAPADFARLRLRFSEEFRGTTAAAGSPRASTAPRVRWALWTCSPACGAGSRPRGPIATASPARGVQGRGRGILRRG